MMRVAAIDQGTTSTRCLVVGEDGVHLASARRHAHDHPAANWVEHDPEELLRNIEAVLESAGPVDAIALANQGESCLAWDAQSGRPLSPVIVWQDARTAEALKAFGDEAQQLSRRISGLPLDPYFSASKLAWLLKNLPAVAEAFAAKRLRLGTTDAFFLQRLSGEFLTDVATASRTGLMDLERLEWSADLCELHGVPIECLPRIVPVNHGFGAIQGVPVLASIVDQQAALYGHGCRQAGDSKITFGTGAFFLALTGPTRPEPDALLPTIAWQLTGQRAVYAIEAGVYDAGAALEWARRLGLYTAHEELQAFDGPTALSRGIVFVPALSGLAAPHWDRTAAPLFIGMDHATDRRDLVRAVLEGVAMLTASLIDTAARTCPLGRAIAIDGGLSQSHYFAEFLASACQRSVAVPSMYELSALGLAGLCGVDIQALRGTVTRVHPGAMVSDSDRQRFAAAVARAKGWRD